MCLISSRISLIRDSFEQINNTHTDRQTHTQTDTEVDKMYRLALHGLIELC